MAEEIKKPGVKQAVALKYRARIDDAPTLIAKGQGLIAERIIAIANEHKIPIYQNKTMTSMLMALDLDREVPPELYMAVAEILAYIYRLDQKRAKR